MTMEWIPASLDTLGSQLFKATVTNSIVLPERNLHKYSKGPNQSEHVVHSEKKINL